MEHTKVILVVRIVISHEKEQEFWDRLNEVKRILPQATHPDWLKISSIITNDIPRLPRKDEVVWSEPNLEQAEARFNRDR